MAVDIAALNALTAQWAAVKADLDDTENRQKINYNNAIDQMRRTNAQNVQNIGVQAADRGMTHSGIRGQTEIKNQEEFNRAQALKAQEQQLALSTIARKRLEADQGYNTQKVLF